jgi:hypothetical protein
MSDALRALARSRKGIEANFVRRSAPYGKHGRDARKAQIGLKTSLRPIGAATS